MINLQPQVVYFPTNVFVGNVIRRWLIRMDMMERKGKERKRPQKEMGDDDYDNSDTPAIRSLRRLHHSLIIFGFVMVQRYVSQTFSPHPVVQSPASRGTPRQIGPRSRQDIS